MKELKERNKAVKRWCKKGYSYRYVGNLFGISRQRAHQIDHHNNGGFWSRLLDKVLYFLKDY